MNVVNSGLRDASGQTEGAIGAYVCGIGCVAGCGGGCGAGCEAACQMEPLSPTARAIASGGATSYSGGTAMVNVGGIFAPTL